MVGTRNWGGAVGEGNSELVGVEKGGYMFTRLIQKELLHHVLDFRFLAIFVLCTLLSVLSVYVGIQNYNRQLQQHDVVSEYNRLRIQARLEKNSVWDLIRQGILWNRRPEVLSPVVYGMSGKLGQEVQIQYPRAPFLEDSLFSVDPIHALFGILDFAFIVKIILSLCVLLLTYDAICGEKESGTLRLAASFSVPRSTLASAKLAGSTVTALVPLVFSFLLVSVVMALSPDLGLRGSDWARMAAVMGVFVLYLVVFVAFGLWVSALTHRRMSAFLGLLGLWTVWTFIVPNLALRIAQGQVPVESLYRQERLSNASRWELNLESKAERDAYWERNPVANWDSLTVAQREGLLEGQRKIRDKWDGEFYSRLGDLQTKRRNQMKRQQGLVMTLSAISPLGAVSYTSMDLARTGLVQHERLEDAINAYAVTMARYIQKKRSEWWETRVLTDFAWFSYQDSEALGGVRKIRHFGKFFPSKRPFHSVSQPEILSEYFTIC